MREQLAHAIAFTPGVWFAKLSPTQAAIVALIIAFLAGGGAYGFFGEFAGHETRIRSLEAWRVIHEDTVTAPRLRQLDAMQSTQDTNLQRLMRIETLLSCIYYEIDRCPDPAPNPPPSGR